MNKSIFFTAIFLLSGIVFINTATADDKPGTTNNPGKVTVVVYPNPVVDVVTILFERPVDEPIVETFNVNGQRLPVPSTGGDGDGGSNKTEVDLSTLAPGIYFLKVYTRQEVIHVQQIIKY
jgi:hypothetical protein